MQITLSELSKLVREEKFRINRETRKRYGQSAIVAYDEPKVAHIDGQNWFAVTCAYRIISTVGQERNVQHFCISIAA